MKDNEYLLPPGDEVCAGSAVEAFYLFRDHGVEIEELPVLGTIRRKSDPRTSYCVWAVNKGRFHLMSLFTQIKIPVCTDWQFAPVGVDEMIMYTHRRTYKTVYDSDLGLCVRIIDVYWHERYPRTEAAIIGYPEARFMLCRIYVTAENSRFLTVCWIGYEEASNATLFIKMFEEDKILLAGYSYTELGREAIDVGERFEVNGRHFVLREDKNGYQFAEPVFYNSQMRLIRCK